MENFTENCCLSSVAFPACTNCHAKLLSEINLQMLISSLSSGAIKTVNDAKRMIG